MLNLTDLRRVLKGASEPLAPSISALVIFDQPEAVVAKIGEKFKELGLKADEAKKYEDGTLMFAQDENPEEDATMLRMSDNLIVVVKGFADYAESMANNADFSQAVRTRGFFQNVSVAGHGLIGSVQEQVVKAESQEKALTTVQDMVKKFEGYVTAMVKGVPQVAFKADAAVAEVLAEMATKNEQEEEKPKEEEKPAVPAAKAEKPAEDEKPVENAEKGLTLDQVAALVAKSLEPLNAALTKLTTTTQAAVDGQAALSTRVDEIARKSDDVAKKLNGTVAAGANPDDKPGEGDLTKKSEEDDSPFGNGVFDTAFMSRRRR